MDPNKAITVITQGLNQTVTKWLQQGNTTQHKKEEETQRKM